jgi:hypothetical protein
MSQRREPKYTRRQKIILFKSLLSEPRESQVQAVILKTGQKKKRKENHPHGQVRFQHEPSGPRSRAYDPQRTIILLPKFTRNFALRRHYHHIHRLSLYFWRALWTVSMILSTTLGSESCEEYFVSYCSDDTIAGTILLRDDAYR